MRRLFIGVGIWAALSTAAFCLEPDDNVESAAVVADAARIAADARQLGNNAAAPGKDSKPKAPRDYSKEDALKGSESQSVVLDGNSLYFIEGGHLFEKNMDSGRVSSLAHAFDVKSILVFKKTLVALQNSHGKIWVRYPFAEEWIEIGFNAQRILATDQDLLALTRDRSQYSSGNELWIYKGKPGEKGFWGQKHAFYDVGLRNVVDIRPKIVSGARDIEIKFRDGRSALFSAIKPAVSN